MVLLWLGVRVLWTGALLAAVSASVVITPPKVVVKYEGSTSAVCTTNLTNNGMGWEAPLEPVDMTPGVKSITWKVDKITEWDISPFCYLITKNNTQEKQVLTVIVYQVPDNVSISLPKPSGPVVEGSRVELQCSIRKAAPARSLVVTWYKGKTVLKRQNFTDPTITPKDQISTLAIVTNRTDNGAEYTCEAKLELGPEGPQPPPTKTSVPLRMNVLHGPKFSRNVEMFQQMEKGIVLNCTVRGNPPPSYSWDPPIEGQTLNTNTPVLMLPPRTAGNYTCTARNDHGSDQKHFTISPSSEDLTTFWAIIGSGLVLVVVLIIGYLVKRKMSSNSVV